jgi:ribosomal-protein-alanine N-acetyltransferase
VCLFFLIWFCSFGRWSCDGNSNPLLHIAVSAEYRRMGIAQELVERLVSALSQRGVHSLTLEVRASNEPAKALYSKLDFQQVGRRPNYYRNPKEDALILRKEWQV